MRTIQTDNLTLDYYRTSLRPQEISTRISPSPCIISSPTPEYLPDFVWSVDSGYA